MEKYNNREYNHLILKNYQFLSLFESKYAIYNGERIASSIEKILEILQDVFLKDITQKKYSDYLYQIVLIGSNVTKKSAEFSGKKISQSELIKKNFIEAQESVDNENYINSIPKFERILSLLRDAITQNEIGTNFKTVDAKSTPINMRAFSKEYSMLFDSISTNEMVYKKIDNAEKVNFPNLEISSVLSRDTAIHEIHQGFTHLTRHINNGYSNEKELERFKSHIRRASLDLLKLSIESIRNYFLITDNTKSLHQMTLAFSNMKNQEVTNVVSNEIASLKQKYILLIDEYLQYIK